MVRPSSNTYLVPQAKLLPSFAAYPSTTACCPTMSRVNPIRRNCPGPCVSNSHVVTFPVFGSFTSTCTYPCGLINSTFEITPSMLIFLFASNSDENEWCANTGRENATKRKAANKTPCVFLMVESLRICECDLVGPLFNSLENNVSRTLRITIIAHLKQQFQPELNFS